MRTKIALAGCGRWGRNILRDLLALECDVFVADPDPEARQRASSGGAQRVAQSLEALCHTDGVVVATPTVTHAAVVREALARGVPVFVEKPMTSNPADARELSHAEGRLFVMDKWRYHPGVEELRRVREAGELGMSRGMHLRHMGWGQPHTDVDVIWILAPHCLTIALEVLGRIPPVRQAFVEALDGEAVTMTCLLADDHAWATLEVSSRSPIKRREFRLHCDQGVAWLDEGWSDHIKIARGRGASGGDATEVECRAVSSELPLLRELRMFVDHLNGGPPPRSSASEGAAIVERIHEIRRMAGLAE